MLRISVLILLCAATASAEGLLGAYSFGRNFADTRLERIDPILDFAWGDIGPFVDDEDEEISERNEQFCVRWTGNITPPETDEYSIEVRSDDGIRVWIDGRIIVDNWTNHPPRFDYGRISLLGGVPYEIMIEYFQGGGNAVLELHWRQGDGPRVLVPTEAMTPLPPDAFPTTLHLNTRNHWAIEGDNAGATFTVYRRGGFEEELIVPVIISTLGEGPILQYQGLQMRNGQWTLRIPPGRSAAGFSIHGVDDIIQTPNAEILVSLGQPPGFALASSNPVRVVVADDDDPNLDSVPGYKVAGTLSGEAASDALWTVTAVATDQDLELAAYAFLGETFLLDGLVDGEYEVQAWLDENENGLLDEDESRLVDEQGMDTITITVPPSLAGVDFHLPVDEMESEPETPVEEEPSVAEMDEEPVPMPAPMETTPSAISAEPSTGCNTTNDTSSGFDWRLVLLGGCFLTLARRRRHG